jgi:hypothetical protein
MKPAPCSWRASTWRTVGERASASYNGSTAPPGMPAIVATPCRSSKRITISAPE